MSRPDEQYGYSRGYGPRTWHAHISRIDERVCVTVGCVLLDYSPDIRHSQPDYALRSEDSARFPQKALGFNSVEMFEHMRTIKDFDRAARQRDFLGGVSPDDGIFTAKSYPLPLG